jgi:hypothetical protein
VAACGTAPGPNATSNYCSVYRQATLASLCLLLELAGCASTKVEFTGKVPATSICQSPGEALSALVLWGPMWRPDQKDVPQREEAARQGLQDFLSASGCFASHQLRRLPVGNASLVPGNSELLALAASASPRPDRILVVTVKELGPIVKVLSSASLVEGGTEVVLGLTVLDTNAGTSIASFQVHWQNGGAMVLKGVASLPDDMNAALTSAVSPTVRARGM